MGIGGIESADAALLATMASYDDVLVLLTAQVAQTYTTIRLTEEQLGIAYQNIEIQRRSYEIVEVLSRRGDKSALDLQQALTLGLVRSPWMTLGPLRRRLAD